ncbi:glycosyl transferase family 1 [Hallella multisaccharivorax DSM 17128]|uniref:Glycosyltransferase n=1 Tax=Hallella multisaccharivorax DSM 17128 TaxID=688246 RepID=F8NC26_9BACT|nr:hypothetical protein [Hallella multisaccharivorax]EGN56993.1 hypothetical protein Premu_1580 [Hallella multisaccharivorax DSM 17128]GJG30535.1 glycosyl transferase family 1 [Hallella multisaccharivorax DSM 17128]
MKILLIGEYSNVHATLAEGLRQLGHSVTVVSNGDFWKNYPRDIDVSREKGRWGGYQLSLKIASILPKLRNYDTVQLINPLFFELKAKHIPPLYKYLRNHNRKIVLGAFGMDYYWVHENITRLPLRYSDFNIGHRLRKDHEAAMYINDWTRTEKERANQLIAQDCDAIVAGLYEYWVAYQPVYPTKTSFIPFPIKLKKVPESYSFSYPLRLFIGINQERSVYKGTDIMLKAAQNISEKYPDRAQLFIAESLPFPEYTKAMQQSDVLLDQLYSYTPAMNALEAMSRGIIVIGGGEPENYDILNEHELRPIINVEPNYDSVYTQLERLILNPDLIPALKQQSVEYIRRHHDYIKVAKRYEQLYNAIH